MASIFCQVTKYSKYFDYLIMNYSSINYLSMDYLGKCIVCNLRECNVSHFQQNFKNWTSDNNDIDKFIQDTQLSAHNKIYNALEWIPYYKLHNIKGIESSKLYRANWIGGHINKWDDKKHKWKRGGQNMFVVLKNLNNSEFMDEIALYYKLSSGQPYIIKFYGITQDPETKNYMMVLRYTENKNYLYTNDIICESCNCICIAKRFQLNFNNWTSGNIDIDKFIQDTQLSTHNKIYNALEWIPYYKLHNIENIAKDESSKVSIANWIDGHINKWDDKKHKWRREDQNMSVVLKSLNNSKFMDEITLYYKLLNRRPYTIEFYGITQDLETNTYMMVLKYIENNTYLYASDIICKNCNCICIAKRFQLNFNNWTSGNNYIDKFIQDTQLSAHSEYKLSNVLEWIPYDKLHNIKDIGEDEIYKVYKANWIDGHINKWDNKKHKWKREGQNMFVVLKNLINSKLMDEIALYYKLSNGQPYIIKLYGITQDLETNNYMMVLKYVENNTYLYTMI
ncbi:hypothetical protein C1645_215088 [Glomus cerebriforme]|uniref:Protein kinase domain-containing protein n=1 Tax=Glomus cerebriforme TaxID=658196 RepID=A0A397SSV0_9GLOM|nr:hypothetical protein C1645_215088 [Glomus cerebriforme]